VGAVTDETPGAGSSVLVLADDRAEAVLEIGQPVRAHPRILDAAKVDPRLAVLVSEQRPETDARFAAHERSPGLLVCRGPRVPCVGLDCVVGRTEREDVE